MELTLLRDHLKSSLETIQRVSTGKTHLPILGNFLIKATKDGVTLKGTDLEIGFQAFLKAKVSQEGEAALPIKAVLGFLQGYPDETIVLKTAGNALSIEGEKVFSNILGSGTEDFPLIPQTARETFISVPRESLQEALQKVLVCLKTPGIRSDLGVVYVRVDAGVLTLVSTDAFRLVETKVTDFESNCKGKTFLLPKRFVQELAMLKTEGKSVTLYFDESQVEGQIGEAYLTTRLADFTFPQYEAVIPKEFSFEATCSRAEVKRHLQLAKVFASRANDVTFGFESEKRESFELRARSEQTGEFRAVVAMEVSPSPADTEFSFDVSLLSDLLDIVASDSVRLLFPKNGLDQKRPLLIKDPNDPDVTALLVQLAS